MLQLNLFIDDKKKIHATKGEWEFFSCISVLKKMVGLERL